MQELEEGLLFPRFRHILDVSATLTAQVSKLRLLYPQVHGDRAILLIHV